MSASPLVPQNQDPTRTASTNLFTQHRPIAEELHGALAPLGAWPGLKVYFRPYDRASWEIFPKFRTPEPESARQEGAARVDEFPVGARGHGAVLDVLTEPPAPSLAILVRQLVQAVMERLSVQDREGQLLEELGANWESLEALYNLNTDLQYATHPQELLDRLIRRTVSIDDGLTAALYVEQDGELELVAGNARSAEPGRSCNDGLMGKALRERHSIVLNGRERLLGISDLESQWRDATSIAVTPIATRHGLVGAMAVWRSDGKGEFGSPLLRLLEALGNQAAMIIEGDRLNRALRESERLRQEIEIASSIQQILLLDSPPDDQPRLEIAAFTLASQRIDGDFCEFVRHENGVVDVLVGDVMGKGVPAALLGAATKHHLVRAMAELASSSADRSTAVPLGDVVTLAAGRMSGQLIALERFVTLCYARLDPDTLRLEYVDCGHPSTIHYHAQTGECSFLHGGENLPLGVRERETYEQSSTPVAHGDILLFYSDGVSEARDGEGEFFGEHRLADCIRRNAELSCPDLLETIRQEVVVFSENSEFADDFTCVAVRFRMPVEGQPLVQRRAVFRSDVRQVSAMRAWALRLAAQVPGGVAQERLASLELAMSEAVTNIIQHAYRGSTSGSLEFSGEVFPDRVNIQINDWGEPFNPAETAPPSFDGSRDGGFGVYIIRESVDAVSYSREPDGRNCITLTQFREPL